MLEYCMLDKESLYEHEGLQHSTTFYVTEISNRDSKSCFRQPAQTLLSFSRLANSDCIICILRRRLFLHYNNFDSTKPYTKKKSDD